MRLTETCTFNIGRVGAEKMTEARWYGVITKSDNNPFTVGMGGIPSFNFRKSINDKFGSGVFTLINRDGEYSSDFIEGKDFKFYYGYDAIPYVYGGYISRIERSGDRIVFTVEHYMNLLNRAIIRNEKFTTQTGSYMINDNTNGLIEKYFNDDAVQTDINVTNNVRASAGQDTFSADFDNVSAFEAMQEISRRSRVTGNSIPFDYWVDYDTVNSNIALWFKESNVTSSGVTLRQDYDFSRTSKVIKGTLGSVKNWVKVYGAKDIVCPINQDFWTEFANDAGYQAIWSEDGGDVSTTVERDTAQYIVGSSSVELTSDVNDATVFKLNFNDTDAYDADQTPHLISSGNGIILDDTKDLYLDFWMRIDKTHAEDWHVKLWLYDDAAVTHPLKGAGLAYNASAGGIYTDHVADAWQKYRFRINDSVSANDANYIYALGIVCDKDTPVDNLRVNVDGLFLTLYDDNLTSDPDAGTPHAKDATSITAYGKREYHYYDRNLRSQTVVDDMADKLLVQLKDPNETYYLNLSRANTNIDLGETFIIDFPLHGIATQTLRCVELQYSNFGMIIVGEKSSIYAPTDAVNNHFTRNLIRFNRELQRR